MRSSKRTSLLLLALLFAAYACDLPGLGLSLTNTGADATSVALTLSAIIAATQQASGQTPQPPSPTGTTTYTAPPPTATSIPTQTETATLTPSPIPYYTPTSLVPMISVSVPTNCRTGPGLPYDRVGALLVGETVQVYAVDPTGQFWYIQNPDDASEFCWVWGHYATLIGVTAFLPVYTPAPTPTPTTPAPGFDASFDSLLECSGVWYLQFRLKNTGLITFHSVEVSVKDTDTGTSVSTSNDDFFDQADCSSTTSRSQLLPGKAVMVSSPGFTYDPTGNRLKTTITLCSKTGLGGICSTENLTFRP